MILDPFDGRCFRHIVLLPEPLPVIEAGISRGYWDNHDENGSVSHIVVYDNEPPILSDGESIFLK